jgi:hypothetical protein
VQQQPQDWGHQLIIGIRDWGPLTLAIVGALFQCFPAGTLVSTVTGLQAIETVRPGQQVWGYDPVEGRWRPCRVLQTFSSRHQGRSAFVTAAGATVEATFRHPFWVVRGEQLAERPRLQHLPMVPAGATTPGRWVDAGDLRVGDELLLRGDRIERVEAMRYGMLDVEVYNLDVEGLHCYAVGPNEVLVHNNNGGPVKLEAVNPDGAEMGGPQKGYYVVWHATNDTGAENIVKNGINPNVLADPNKFHVSIDPKFASTFGADEVAQQGGALKLVRIGIPIDLFDDLYLNKHIMLGAHNSLILDKVAMGKLNEAIAK